MILSLITAIKYGRQDDWLQMAPKWDILTAMYLRTSVVTTWILNIKWRAYTLRRSVMSHRLKSNFIFRETTQRVLYFDKNKRLLKRMGEYLNFCNKRLIGNLYDEISLPKEFYGWNHFSMLRYPIFQTTFQ